MYWAGQSGREKSKTIPERVAPSVEYVLGRTKWTREIQNYSGTCDTACGVCIGQGKVEEINPKLFRNVWHRVWSMYWAGQSGREKSKTIPERVTLSVEYVLGRTKWTREIQNYSGTCDTECGVCIGQDKVEEINPKLFRNV